MVGKDTDPPNIAIIGFMGAGKSTVGSILAGRLDMEHLDLDEYIEAKEGRNIPDIFSAGGEREFREREEEALKRALQGSGRVISCGGGVVLKEENIRRLRERARVFLLDVEAEEAAARLRDAGGRPLLEGGDRDKRIERMLEERAAFYRRAAHEIIETGGLAPEDIAEEIMERWRR